MKIAQMQQILEICKCGSINKAAKNLYISQSSLSASLQATEEELGIRLLNRTHSGIALTEDGARFLEVCGKIIGIYDDFLAASKPTFSSRLYISSQFLRYAVNVYTSLASEVDQASTEFKYKETDSIEVVDDVIQKRSDIGIVVTPTVSREKVLALLDKYGLESHILCTDEGVCLVGPGSPLYTASGEYVSTKQLSIFPRLNYERREWSSEVDLFREEYNDFPCSGLISISDSGSFQNFMSHTNCYFIGVHNEAAYQATSFHRDIKVLKMTDCSFPFDTIWIKGKNRELTPLVTEYLNRLYRVIGKEQTDLLTP